MHATCIRLYRSNCSAREGGREREGEGGRGREREGEGGRGREREGEGGRGREREGEIDKRNTQMDRQTRDSIVRAHACTPPDLFWSGRSGSAMTAMMPWS